MTSRIPISSRRHTAAAALLTAAVLTGTACTSGQASPAATPSIGPPASSSSATPTPTPTPKPTASYKPADAAGRAQNVPVPVLPEAAKAETKEGLEAFARYWYSALSYAYETGDMGPLDSVSAPTCASCARVKKVVEGWHAEGRWLAGGKMVVEGSDTSFIETGPLQYQILIQVHQEPLSYYRADKVLDETTQQGPALGDIMVASFAGGAWRAITVEHLVKNP
ncbi:hypothetical protein FFF93_003640 [Arthrobacter sp. KBS0702]|uniref:DUF6318 family protein n=1 Tax=Arthrobacter sp. KBS0702 TaxID=2578107 RepID=UPI00110D801F|nr:DUF6318 family protein [Arthrobacter sp. KBS0702]QDW28975.1 hypothetical protein FFF93_003640 [Arthrobacter sp. KBS0702]